MNCLESIKKSAKKSKQLNIIWKIFDLLSFIKCKYKGYYAQNGEDLFLLEYFKDTKGFYIDVGANHPFKNSNTYLLYKQGWRGINIEPIPARYSKLVKHRPKDINLNVGVGQAEGKMKFYEMSSSVLSTFDKEVCDRLVNSKKAILYETYNVSIKSLANIVKEHCPHQQVNILSIDTEGLELEVLKGIDWEQMHPDVIVIELFRNLTKNKDDEKDEIVLFLEYQDYKIIKQIGGNSIFTHIKQ